MRRLVWLNGPFGVGKTTIADLLGAATGLRIVDPELVGSVLAEHLGGLGFDDFQDIPAWRRLVPRFLAEIAAESGDDLIAVQTVLQPAYWQELTAGLVAERIEVAHIVLDADEASLRSRIDADDPIPRLWRQDHVGTFVAARPWMAAAADLVIDTSTATPEDVVGQIVHHLDA